MTDPIDPIEPGRRAGGERRARARRQADAPSGKGGLPAVIAAPAADDVPLPDIQAHLLGQEGQKRGLRGGPETLAKARAAYLSAEWSGPLDRRNRTGLFSKKDV